MIGRFNRPDVPMVALARFVVVAQLNIRTKFATLTEMFDAASIYKTW